MSDSKNDSKNDSKKDELLYDHNHDGINRRGFLKCMAWAGTGTLCVMQGGVLKSFALNRLPDPKSAAAAGELSFVQISDSHMGFNKAANPDVVATLKAAVDKINASPVAPEFLLHTGDVSHLSRPDEFDAVDQILKSTGKQTFFVPGEHDVLEDDGKQFLERYGKNAKGSGWYSFDQKGVHFIGLVNVMNLKAGGLGTLGHDQLEWLERDVKHLKASTPIVVFAHIPLWTVYPDWGWGTEDSAQALEILEEVWFGQRVERTHSPDDAKGRRQRDVSHGGFDGVSAACAGTSAFAGADESACGTTAELSRDHVGELRARTARAGRRRFKAGLI